MTFPQFFKSQTFLYAAAGAALLYAALPPLDLWPLAWIAPVPWIMLIRRKELAGPKPYLALWLAGFAFWMAALHWLRLADPGDVFRLDRAVVLLCLLCSGFHRPLPHRRASTSLAVMLAAPVVWTGLELARAHLLTGMSMADIAHTQYRWTEVIQIADLAGQYGVGFCHRLRRRLHRADAALRRNDSIARVFPRRSAPRQLASAVIPAAAVRVLSVTAMADRIRRRRGPARGLRSFKARSIRNSAATRTGKFSTRSSTISIFACRGKPSRKPPKSQAVDLIVWPEIFFKEPLIVFDRRRRR